MRMPAESGPGMVRSRARGAGFSLVEVAVALLLLSVGTLGILELARAASADARAADVGERLLWEVTRLADSLGRSPGGSGSLQTAYGAQVRWAVGPDGGWIRAYLAGSDSAWIRIPVVPLTGETLVRGGVPPAGGGP